MAPKEGCWGGMASPGGGIQWGLSHLSVKASELRTSCTHLESIEAEFCCRYRHWLCIYIEDLVPELWTPHVCPLTLFRPWPDIPPRDAICDSGLCQMLSSFSLPVSRVLVVISLLGNECRRPGAWSSCSSFWDMPSGRPGMAAAWPNGLWPVGGQGAVGLMQGLCRPWTLRAGSLLPPSSQLLGVAVCGCWVSHLLPWVRSDLSALEVLPERLKCSCRSERDEEQAGASRPTSGLSPPLLPPLGFPTHLHYIEF